MTVKVKAKDLALEYVNPLNDQYSFTISGIAVGKNGTDTELVYETNPSIAGMKPKEQRRAILSSPRLLALMEILWHFKATRGIPTYEQLKDERAMLIREQRVSGGTGPGKGMVTPGNRQRFTYGRGVKSPTFAEAAD